MKKTILTAFVAVTLAACLAFAQAGQSGQGQQGQPAQPTQPGQDEVTAIQSAMNPTTPPDERLVLAENFLAKFPNSLYKAWAYLAEMQAYQDKKDTVSALDAAEKALKLDPTNLPALVGAAEIIAMRTGDNDLDREQKLKKGEDYGNRAIQILGQVTKNNPMVTDEQFLEQKNQGLASAYDSLGWIAYHRKQVSAAETNFKKAFDLGKQADYAYHLGRVLAQEGKLQPACEAYQQAQVLGGVKNATGVDLVEADRKGLDTAMKNKGTPEGCPAKTPPPPAPTPPTTPPVQKP